MLTLDPARSAWAWHVEVRNDGPGAREVDVVHTHDVALAAPGMLRTNELYVSQYLDIAPLHGDGFGTALAVRQNLAQSGADPVVRARLHDPGGRVGDRRARRARPGSTGRRSPPRVSAATCRRGDGSTSTPSPPCRPNGGGWSPVNGWRRRSPASWSPTTRPPRPTPTSGSSTRRWTSPAPWRRSSPRCCRERETAAGAALAAPTGAYDPDRTLAARPATDAEVERLWPGPWRAVERREDGTLLSFFTADDEHVVTRAKEVGVLRPHGTILRTGDTAAPDPRSLTVTCWMTGSPLSYLTRGNASDDRVLTTVRGYLGLHPDHGVRVFVEVAGRWRLLDLPSAFAMTPDGARWVHVLDPDGEDAGGVLEVRTTAATADHVVRMSVRVTSGPPGA